MSGSASTAVTAAAENNRRINLLCSKIAQSLLMIQQRDLKSYNSVVATSNNKIVSAEPVPNAPMAPSANTDEPSALIARSELSVSEQLLLLFRTKRGKLSGHSTVFGDCFAFNSVMVIAGGLAELIVMGHISIEYVTEKNSFLWIKYQTNDAYLILDESKIHLSTGKPALDEIKSNINLATIRKLGDLLNPSRNNVRAISVQKFLRKFFVGKNHSYNVTTSMLQTMVNNKIIKQRSIKCGLFNIWNRIKYENTEMTEAILGDIKHGIRTVVDGSALPLTSKITLRLLIDAQYLQNHFYGTNRKVRLLHKVFSKEEVADNNFGERLANCLDIPMLSKVEWSNNGFFLAITKEMNEKLLWSLCSNKDSKSKLDVSQEQSIILATNYKQKLKLQDLCMIK